MLGKEKKERLIKTLEVKNFKEDVKCSSIIINEVKRIHSHPKDSSKKPETFWPLGVCFILTTFGMDPPVLGRLREHLSVTRQDAFVGGACFAASWASKDLF